MIRRIAFHIVLLLYIYTVSFSFFPGKLKSRMVIGVIGLLYFLLRKKRWGSQEIQQVALFCIPIFLWSIISMLANWNFDSYFPRQMLLNVLYAFGCYFIIDYFRIDSLEKLFKGVVVCIVANNLLAMVGLVSDGVRNLVVNMQSFEKNSETVLEMSRAVGIGNLFFFGGLVTGLGMILSCFLYKRKQMPAIQFYTVFTFLLVSGLLIARTATTGLIGLLILLFPLRNGLKSVVRLAVVGVVLVYSIGAASDYVSRQIDSKYVEFAFEMVDNYQHSGKVETRSTDRMLDMYRTRPNSLETWLVGDGLVNTPDGGYYMHTDIGYFRLIFAMGIIGLAIYLLIHVSLLRWVCRLNPRDADVRVLAAVLFLYLCVLLFKGMVSLDYFFFLIIFASCASYKYNISCQCHHQERSLARNSRNDGVEWGGVVFTPSLSLSPCSFMYITKWR